MKRRSLREQLDYIAKTLKAKYYHLDLQYKLKRVYYSKEKKGNKPSYILQISYILNGKKVALRYLQLKDIFNMERSVTIFSEEEIMIHLYEQLNKEIEGFIRLHTPNFGGFKNVSML